MNIRTVTATRYITPLREGGSLPALIEGDDNQLYVLKFRGAGQGPRALIAELVVGELLRVLGLPVPEIVFVELDEALARSERDPEIQDLIKASTGLNLALAYIPESLAFDPLLIPPPDPQLASAIVWCDAYLTNVDRTPRNTNMLVANDKLWLIDHGAALYIHHTWTSYDTRSRVPFMHIKDHVLLPYAMHLAETDALLSSQITPHLIETLVAMIPAIWLDGSPHFSTHADEREAYIAYLTRRLDAPRAFSEEAINAHAHAHAQTL